MVSDDKIFLKYWLVLSIILLGSITITHSVFLHFLKRGQISSIVSAVRESVLVDNKREVIALLDQAARSGFISIELEHVGYGKKSVFGLQNPSWWHAPVTREIYFDETHSRSNGKLIFYYSPVEGVQLLLGLWLSMSFLSIYPLKKQVNRIVADRQKDLEFRKNKAVVAIINNLAHDMRAPIGVFERVLNMNLLPDIEAVRSSMREAINRLHAMLESLRYSDAEVFSKPSYRYLDFRFALDALEQRALQRKVSLKFPAASTGRFFLDHVKFERAWINLASNAIDFACAEVRIEVAIFGTELIFRVIDDGPGVPDEFLSKLFQRGATLGKADGTGLGLAYVRQIMRGHGGDVTYRRENGDTIFECRLPNAVFEKEEQALEITTSLELKVEQKLVRKVAICLEPRSLSQAVLAQLTSRKSEEFLFAEEREGAQIVVSNTDDIMFEVMERDDQEFVQVSESWGTEAQMISLLRRKFNLS